jgi:CRP/FNR family transcriptional regulator, cyclic AMP receptor protein
MALAETDLVRLLDVEPELASRLREDDRAEARQRLVARAATLAEGADATAFGDARGHPFGLVVVDGVLVREVRLGGRSSVQLLGGGDVVIPGALASELPATTRWLAATTTTIAILDDRIQAPLALWPGLTIGLLQRVAQQQARLSVHAAALQLPRVEDRLEAVFWDLADRWGRVTPSGIHLPLKLTHDLLARLAGGARPTISLALTALAGRGVVARRRDGSWLIVARAPSASLAAAGSGPQAPPPVVVATVSDAPAPPRGDWLPGARSELLANAQRIRLEHAAAAQRLATGRERFAATRERSRVLREQAAVARRAGRVPHHA